MAVGIITAILPLILKVIEWFLDRAKASKEQKEAFFNWVKKAGEDFSSTKLVEYGDAQLQFLKEHPWEESK